MSNAEFYRFLHNLGIEIAMYRVEKQFTQEDFAKACNISVRALSKIENGTTNFNAEFLYTFLKVTKGMGVFMLLRAAFERDFPKRMEFDTSALLDGFLRSAFSAVKLEGPKERLGYDNPDAIRVKKEK